MDRVRIKKVIMNSPMLFKSALLLAARENLATVDKQALRACGVRDFTILSSGIEAARLLAANGAGRPEMVLCSEKLADMSADDFVRLLRLHPELIPFPVIVAVTSGTQETKDKARACGYSGLLVRPYNQSALQAQMELALRCRNATVEALAGAKAELADPDTTAFDAMLAKFEAANNPEDQVTDQLFRQGLLGVRQQRWDEAISLLQEVVRRDGTHVEALIALGASWQGKGNLTRGSSLMADAVALLADRRQWEKALAVSQRLLRNAPKTPNPLLAEAGRLLASGNIEDLPDALEMALRLPISTPAVDGLVRACSASADPDAREQLLTALRKLGAKNLIELFVLRSSQAPADSSASQTPISAPASQVPIDSPAASPREIYDLPLNPAKKPAPRKKAKKSQELTEPSTSAFERSFPKLHEALMVAKVTLSLFRHLK